MMKAALGYAVLILPLIAVGTSLLLYVESFFGYGWGRGGQSLMVAFLCVFLAGIPTAIRDYLFFRKNWGFGLGEIRNRFPFQMFPARREKWLNPLAWGFTVILLLHFFWLVMNSTDTYAVKVDTHADLRYVSLIVAFGGVLSALAWEYPPTEKPQDLDRQMVP